MDSSSLRRQFAIGLFCLFATDAGIVLAPAGLETLPSCFAQFGASSTQAEQYGGVFLPTDRNAKKYLEQATEMLRQKRYGEAVRLLNAVLDSNEDSFLKPTGKQTRLRGLKAESRRMLGQLSDQGRASYQLQFGVGAKKMLADAVNQGDAAKLAEISRRFFHTDAGYEATVLLGQHHFHHRRPLAAAFAFQQVLNVPRAANRFEPMLSVQAAASWMRAGEVKKAQEIITRLAEEFPSARLQIGGKPAEAKLFAGVSDPLAWLKRTVGESVSAGPSRSDQWAMFRGDGSRNMQGSGGQPLLAYRWQVRTINFRKVEELATRLQDAYRRQGIATLPSLYPLAVGDVVLMRTEHHMLAVDFDNGKMIWEIDSHRNDSFERLVNASSGQQVAGRVPQLAQGLERRLWDDSIYGKLSSDGQRVFVIKDLDLLTGVSRRQMMFVGPGRVVQSSAPKTYNRLAAYELETEGKLLWEVGGPDSEIEELAEAFFLGSPLPISGRLYALVEIKGEIRLYVLDAKTGEPQWSQQLAQVDRTVLQDPMRRMAGATPSFADGVLICPTSAGAVVAVDLTTRSLLWAFEYPRKGYGRRQFFMNGYQPHQPRSDAHWTDASTTVVDGRVLVTPVEASKMFCLDLLDGSELWKQDRGENLYVACVHDKKIVLVGKKQLTAIQLADGKPAWKAAMPLPEGAMPSGRGYSSDGFYYLPLTTAEVAKVDMNQGKIVERVKSRDGNVPGNLICHRGAVLSQGVDFLEKYYQLDPLRQWVDRKLKAQPEDAEALARMGEIKLYEGKLTEAIKLFRRSFNLNPDDELTRVLLVQNLLEGMRKDFAANRTSLEELEKLIDDEDQRVALLRLMADGLQKSGERMPAFESYLSLVKYNLTDENELEKVDEKLSIRRDRWVRSQLASLYETASADERIQMDAAIEQQVTALGDRPTTDDMRRFLSYFGAYSQADQIRVQLADKLLGTDSGLECQMLLHRLERSETPEIRRGAIARMALLLKDTRHPRQAAKYYRVLAGELADQVCLDGKTGSELVAAIPQDDAVAKVLAGTGTWPLGEVKAVVANPDRSIRAVNRRIYPLPLEGRLGPFYDNVKVALDQGQQSVIGFDGDGNERFRVALNGLNSPRQSFILNPMQNYGAVNGHLLVISMGYQIMALDTLGGKRSGSESVIWKSDLKQQIPGVASRNRINAQPINRPGGVSIYRAHDSQGRALGILGPIVEEGITFQRFRDLMCVDPLTGQTLWIRHDVTEGSDLFGDGELLFVVPPGSNQATVLRSSDGTLLGTRKVPVDSQRMRTVGRRVVQWANNGTKQVVSLVDPWEKTEIWKHEFDAGAKTWVIENDAVGVMDSSGKFALISLETGEQIIDEQLVKEPTLVGIYLLRSPDQYFLVTNRPAQQQVKGRTFSPSPGGVDNPMINGRVYAFDRKTGKPQWLMPRTVEQRGLLLSQPDNLPILTFTRHVRMSQKSGRSAMKTSVLCLDRRTGRTVYDKEDFAFQTMYFRMFGNRQAKQVTLAFPSKSVVLTYTGVPLAPEPPAEADGSLPQAAKDKTSRGVIGSLFKILGKAATDLPGGKPPGFKAPAPKQESLPPEDIDDDD